MSQHQDAIEPVPLTVDNESDRASSSRQTEALSSSANASGADSNEKRSPLVFARLRRTLPPPTKTRQLFMLMALMMVMVLLGWNDGSQGPLLPFLQEYYHINYLIMSLIWVTAFVGSLVAGVMNVYLTDRLGFGILAPIGALAQAICYALMSTGGPYPLFVAACVLNGWGFAIQDAQVNTLTSGLPSAESAMFYVQSCFGLGATIAPFISTAFAQHVPTRAYLYYLVAMAVALATGVVLVVVYEWRTEEQVVRKWSERDIGLDQAGADVVEQKTNSSRKSDGPSAAISATGDETSRPSRDGADAGEPKGKDLVIVADTNILPPAPILTGSGEAEGDQTGVQQGSWKKMSRILSTPAVWVLLAYNFIYVGIEVGLGGWITTYLVQVKGGSIASGYATTGFFGGLTVGRIILMPVTKKLGHHTSIYVYSALSLALMLVIWFIHSLIGCAVCFAFIGMFFGPVFPSALLIIADVLDDDLRGGVMGLMGTVGGAGAAALPFITGVISDRFGIWTLQPLMVAMLAADILLWTMVPRKKVHAKA